MKQGDTQDIIKQATSLFETLKNEITELAKIKVEIKLLEDTLDAVAVIEEDIQQLEGAQADKEIIEDLVKKRDALIKQTQKSDITSIESALKSLRNKKALFMEIKTVKDKITELKEKRELIIYLYDNLPEITEKTPILEERGDREIIEDLIRQAQHWLAQYHIIWAHAILSKTIAVNDIIHKVMEACAEQQQILTRVLLKTPADEIALEDKQAIEHEIALLNGRLNKEYHAIDFNRLKGSRSARQAKEIIEQLGSNAVIEVLPTEIWLHILQYVDLQDLVRASCTCKRLHNIAAAVEVQDDFKLEIRGINLLTAVSNIPANNFGNLAAEIHKAIFIGHKQELQQQLTAITAKPNQNLLDYGAKCIFCLLLLMAPAGIAALLFNPKLYSKLNPTVAAILFPIVYIIGILLMAGLMLYCSDKIPQLLDKIRAAYQASEITRFLNASNGSANNIAIKPNSHDARSLTAASASMLKQQGIFKHQDTEDDEGAGVFAPAQQRAAQSQQPKTSGSPQIIRLV